MCVQLAHFNIGDWKDISIAHVIIIKSEVSTFPIITIFCSWLCLLHHILSLIAYTFRENREFANSRIRFGLQIVLVCLYNTSSHYHHCANFLWRHWTYKMPVRYILSSVWVRLSIFSQLSIIQYVGLFVFSLPIYLVMIEIIYILCLIIIIKSEVWTITHCLGLGHETMVCVVCLSVFLFLHTKYILKWSYYKDWEDCVTQSQATHFLW